MGVPLSRETLEKNIDILIDALRLYPDLWAAAQLSILARERKALPARNLESLTRIGAGGKVVIEGMRLNRAQALEFFPKEFFPVLDDADFLRKAFMALIHGRMKHAQDAARATKRGR